MLRGCNVPSAVCRLQLRIQRRLAEAGLAVEEEEEPQPAPAPEGPQLEGPQPEGPEPVADGFSMQNPNAGREAAGTIARPLAL